MLFGNQWKSREQLQRRGCLINELPEKANRRGVVIKVIGH